MLTTYLSKIVMVTLLLLISGCATTRVIYTREQVTIPELPDRVVIEGTKIKDRERVQTVAKPVLDKKRQQASWTFQDTERISRALAEWSCWGVAVKEIIDVHNQTPSKRRKWLGIF